LDDPLDPPPTIDVEYMALDSTEVMQGQPPPPHSDEDPHPIQTISTNPPPTGTIRMQNLTTHDPPPYATPVAAEAPESATGPPPYIESNNSPSP